MEAVKTLSKVDAQRKIRELLDITAQGGADMVEEAVKVGVPSGIGEEYIRELFKTAVRLGREDDEEGFFKNSEVQPIRETIEEPKVEVAKSDAVEPKRREWRQLPNGAWEYRLEGEGIFRRHFGPPPKDVGARALPKPEPEQEEEPEKVAADAAGTGTAVAVVRAQVPVFEPVEATGLGEAVVVMNRQHAIIENIGGKTVIASWEPSTYHTGKMVIVFQSKESFLLRYSNRFVSVPVYTGRVGISSIVKMPLGQWWLAHADRQQYRGITFLPNGPGGSERLFEFVARMGR
jgi:hypothetical protein